MPLDPNLLDLLACPRTHTKLRYDAVRERLVSDDAGLAYPVRDGIPVLLPEEALQLTAEEAGGGPA